MAQPKKQNFLYGAAMLTGTVIIVKILGFIYKIPLYNMLGDAGTAHFGVAYNIYSLLLTLSTAGLPVALSKMIASADALGNEPQIKRTFSVARMTFFVLGAVCSVGMFVFNDALAEYMGDTAAAASIRVLAPSVLLCCLMSAYRGYAQGLSIMVATSVSQIIEVLAKLIFGLGLAYIFLKAGQSSGNVAAGAIAGVTIGSFVALIYTVWYKRRIDKSRAAAAAEVSFEGAPAVVSSRSSVLKELLKIAIPITVGSSIISIITLIDSQQILSRLQSAAGFSADEAATLYGVYYKGLTLFNLPASFINPLTISIIPAISAAITKHDDLTASSSAESAMRIATLMALPAAIGMSVLSYPIFNVLYPNSASEGPSLLMVLGLATFFVCVAIITNAILQAYGYGRITLIHMCIGGLLKIGLNYILVGIPSINIHGAPIGNLTCYAVIALLNIIYILRKIPHPPKMSRVFVRPLIASVIMGAVAYLSYTGLAALLGGSDISRLGMIVALVVAIGLAVVVYLVLIVGVKAITKDDVLLLPKGEKIAKILKMK